MNNEIKKVFCDFDGLSDKSQKYFLEALDSKELSVYHDKNQVDCSSDMICSFSCLDNYLRCISGQKSLYIPKPVTQGIRIEAILNDNDCVWCTGYGMYANSLIKIDKLSLRVEIFPMPYKNVNKERLFVGLLRVENRIYLIPENSIFIAVFSVTDCRWEKIDIEGEMIDGWFYSAAVEVNGCVYFMPNKAKSIIKLDCDDGKEIIQIEIPREIKKYNDNYAFCGIGAVITINKDIYFYSRIYNSFMKFDTEKKCFELVRKLQETDSSLACVTEDNTFWMFAMSGNNKIVKYDVSKNKVIYYDDVPKIEYNRAPFYQGTKIGNEIVFAPGVAEKAIAFNTVTSEIKVLEGLDIETYERTNETWIYSCIDSDEENIYLFETNINKFVKYNLKSNIVEKHELHVNEKDWYVGQAKKVIQMVVQDMEPSRILEKDIIAEY